MTSPTSWPPAELFRDQVFAEVASDGAARCTGVIICAEDGRPARSVFWGEAIQVFTEFEIRSEIETPVGWIEISDAAGRLIHGRNSAQLAAFPPTFVQTGSRLRVHFVVDMEIGPGAYTFTVGLSSADEESYAAYRLDPPVGTAWPEADVPRHERTGMNRQAPLTEERFLERLREHCRVALSANVVVGFDDQGRRPHSGAASLPARCDVSAVPPGGACAGASADGVSGLPTVIHVTHPKAGSQWVAQILADCTPDRIVPPRLRSGQLFFWSAQPGMVYPTVYARKQQFDTLSLPENSRIFVVIRDLRDTLISYYFSFLKSHAELDRTIYDARRTLSRLSLEDGLLHMLDGWMAPAAQIQLSWSESGYQLIKYEDLIDNDVEMFEQILVDQCGLDISPSKLKSIVLANRFERYTNGRPRGQEEAGHHYRKGIAGDWTNHFTDRVKQAFKARYGGLLVETGYERDLNW